MIIWSHHQREVTRQFENWHSSLKNIPYVKTFDSPFSAFQLHSFPIFSNLLENLSLRRLHSPTPILKNGTEWRPNVWLLHYKQYWRLVVYLKWTPYQISWKIKLMKLHLRVHIESTQLKTKYRCQKTKNERKQSKKKAHTHPQQIHHQKNKRWVSEHVQNKKVRNDTYFDSFNIIILSTSVKKIYCF